MAEPFLGEIKIISWNFPPKGWAFCNGQLLPINQNQALFSILGTTYGGDGRVNFGLPDLQGRVPIHMGSGFTEGERGGETSHTLTISELPAHVHLVQASLGSATQLPGTNHLLAVPLAPIYHVPDNNAIPLNPATVTNTGGSQPHNNMMPYLTLNFCIALQGIFPSQN